MIYFASSYGNLKISKVLVFKYKIKE